MTYKKSMRLFCYLLCTSITFIGCATKKEFNDNVVNGHELALLFRINENNNASPIYPASLMLLSNQLSSAGIQAHIPQCRCADGQMRNFIYIPGFDSSDGAGWVFLVSPPEMDSSKSVVVYLDTVAKLVSKEEASDEIHKSQEFIHARQEAAQSPITKPEKK